MRYQQFFLVVFLSMAGVVVGQSLAPRDTATVQLEGKRVAVEYGRPSLKGRSFQDLLQELPEDRVWRAGSDQVTTLETDTDLRIGGNTVPAGRYSVYIHFSDDNQASLILNQVLGQPLGKIWNEAPPNLADEPWPHFSYQKEIGDKEVARVPLESLDMDASTEMFTIELKPDPEGAQLNLLWGDQAWTAPVAPVH